MEMQGNVPGTHNVAAGLMRHQNSDTFSLRERMELQGIVPCTHFTAAGLIRGILNKEGVTSTQ